MAAKFRHGLSFNSSFIILCDLTIAFTARRARGRAAVERRDATASVAAVHFLGRNEMYGPSQRTPSLYEELGTPRVSQLPARYV